MLATATYHLHVSRNGVVRDRNNLGTGPSGPVLGHVRKTPPGGPLLRWVASDANDSLVGGGNTRREALDVLFKHLTKGQK